MKSFFTSTIWKYILFTLVIGSAVATTYYFTRQ